MTSKEDFFLKVVPVKIYGTGASVLLDRGAVPNLISTDLSKNLNLVPKPAQKMIAVGDGVVQCTPKTEGRKTTLGVFGILFPR